METLKSTLALSTTGNGQYLAYQMTVKASRPVAMILPIPVPVHSAEGAVKFINLHEFADFFPILRRAFDPPVTRSMRQAPAPTDHILQVVKVGSFVASFVPAIKDFSRLDAQFRLPSQVWDSLPIYKDFGFVVFQLQAGEHRVHPMAFKFPRRNPARLFFPTVHIHDGKVHPTAHFDHELYCQRLNQEPLHGWQESLHQLDAKAAARSQGLVDGTHHLYRRKMVGDLTNQDVIV